MAIFEAYFDESGTHKGSSVTMVAGALAKRSSWLSMGRQWKAILKKFGAHLFHATDLNNFRGEFEGWDETRRRSLTAKLLKVITEERPTIFGIGVASETYDRVKANFPDVPLTAYQFCCEFDMVWAGKHVTRKKHIPPIKVVFEAGQKFTTATIKHTQNLLRQRAKRELHGIAEIRVVPKSCDGVTIVPLQVADLIAYELYKYYSTKAYRGESPLRHPLLHLMENLDKFVGGILSERVIREYLMITQRFIERRKKNL